MASGVSDALFHDLCEVTLCRALLLNRIRVGEVQFMELKDYLKSLQNPLDENADELKALTVVEKRGRPGPVLPTGDTKAAVQAITDLWCEVSVPESNEFLFPALHDGDGHFRADVVMRKMANTCGALDPTSLTGTRLGKHIATCMTLLNFREHDLDAVADFMGHDIRVQRQCYRLSSDTMQLAKVSNILLNMETETEKR
ncbi:hypothetical protein FOCC_FOCC016610 [Frankliniella occidentalis]|nr:hypothetical protein FOCC_FOCC016610 [Frankliniella occidentalis]